ncbi:1913_t:CDS:1 [Cetraspora pellucida]|uniref:1913_t:CDS:1 n=1 Tax=Cetraspora pellucida TaxID=1433469 RepID=A0A9N9AV81_9GLOM|nr:1913_t:CDS:1 [Cetraspora pellucida]
MNTHLLFNSIFEETHNEIKDLNYELNQLQEIYQAKYNLDDNESDNNEDNCQCSTSDLLLNNIDELDDYFTLQQIKEFQKIFFQNSIQYSKECNIKQQQCLKKYDDEAFLTKLNQKNCCKENCLSTKVNPETALNRFYKIKAMSQSEMNMYFLGMIDGSIKIPKSKYASKASKLYLVTSYNFSGASICQVAWLTIHGIGKTKWEALRTYYQNHGLKPKIHALTS